MNFLEKDLEQIIFEADKEELSKRGLHIYGKLYRQLRIGNYGIADLIEVNRVPKGALGSNTNGKLWITVYELKKEKVNVSTFLQALGYATGITRYLENRRFGFDIEVNIVLVGKELELDSTFSFLPSFLDYYGSGYNNILNIYEYKYGTEGILFKQQEVYRLIEEGF